jgi:hypothetical protein
MRMESTIIETFEDRVLVEMEGTRIYRELEYRGKCGRGGSTGWRVGTVERLGGVLR